MNATNQVLQFRSTAKVTAWEIAQAVAADIMGRGHRAKAVKGPAACSPDDESTVHCAHVQTTAEGFAAYHAGREARKAAKASGR